MLMIVFDALLCQYHRFIIYFEKLDKVTTITAIFKSPQRANKSNM